MESERWELYDASEPEKLRNSRRIWIAAAVMIALLGLGVCIALCVLARPETGTAMMIAAIAVSTLTGWIDISISYFAVSELKHIEKHTEAMLKGERKTEEGPFTLTNERLRVKKGVGMVRLDGPRGSVQVFDGKAKRLQGVTIRSVESVYGFVVACEVERCG